jgi:segregation and condensation protein B
MNNSNENEYKEDRKEYRVNSIEEKEELDHNDLNALNSEEKVGEILDKEKEELEDHNLEDLSSEDNVGEILDKEKEELEDYNLEDLNSEDNTAEILNEEIEVNSQLEIPPKEEDSIQVEITETKVSDEKPLEDQIREFNRNLIEASLYAAGSPLTIEEISTKLELTKKEVESLITDLAYDYLDRPTALVIAQIGERYQMQLKPEYTEKVSKFAKGGGIAERYLRTLTVIALKQPILKSTIVKIRGTGAYEHIKYLGDNGFIDAVKKGRSHLLTTTDKYADMFGLPKDIRLLKKAMSDQLGVEGEKSEENQE